MRSYRIPAVIGLLWAMIAASNAGAQESTNPALKDPSLAKETAPDTFRAKFVTTQGDILFDCDRSWGPNGVDRFYNLVKIGFYNDTIFFRVAKGFVVQWGIHGNPEVSAKWRDARIPPDPVKQSNARGTLTYAMSGNSNATRTTQLFINYADNANLDKMSGGFTPICKVVEGGMDVADKLYSGYPADEVSSKQGEIQSQGNAFLRENFPKLDSIKTTSIVSEGGRSVPSEATPGEKPAAQKEEESNTLLYVLGAVGLGAVAVYLYMRGRGEEAPPPPPQKPAPQPSGMRKAAKKKKKKKRVRE